MGSISVEDMPLAYTLHLYHFANNMSICFIGYIETSSTQIWTVQKDTKLQVPSFPFLVRAGQRIRTPIIFCTKTKWQEMDEGRIFWQSEIQQAIVLNVHSILS